MFKLDNNKNKELLWDILYENGIFQNISNSKINEIQKIFESTIISFVKNNQDYINKIDNQSDFIIINKKIINILINIINQYKSNINNFINNKDNTRKNDLVNISNNFTSIKSDMEILLNPKKPESIDFSDKVNDDPINNEDMNKKLEQMQNDRLLDVKIFDKNKISDNNITENMIFKNKLNIDNDDNAKSLEKNDIIELNDNDNKNIKQEKDEKDKKGEKPSRNKSIIDNINTSINGINEFILNDYDNEFKLNINRKLEGILNTLKEIKITQDLILNKLEIS